MKEFKVTWTRLYQRLEHEGFATNAIVVYRVRPYMQARWNGRTVITQYQKGLLIDLWLCKVRLQWLTRELKQVQYEG